MLALPSCVRAHLLKAREAGIHDPLCWADPESQHPSRVFTVLGGGRLLGTWHSERSGRVDVLFFGAGRLLRDTAGKIGLKTDVFSLSSIVFCCTFFIQVIFSKWILKTYFRRLSLFS